MRIIGSIDHPRLKISIFRNDNRISIKFENSFYEQTFKMKESITSTEDATRFVDDIFCENIEKNFIQMHQSKMEAMQRFSPPAENDFFDEII